MTVYDEYGRENATTTFYAVDATAGIAGTNVTLSTPDTAGYTFVVYYTGDVYDSSSLSTVTYSIPTVIQTYEFPLLYAPPPPPSPVDAALYVVAVYPAPPGSLSTVAGPYPLSHFDSTQANSPMYYETVYSVYNYGSILSELFYIITPIDDYG